MASAVHLLHRGRRLRLRAALRAARSRVPVGYLDAEDETSYDVCMRRVKLGHMYTPDGRVDVNSTKRLVEIYEDVEGLPNHVRLVEAKVMNYEEIGAYLERMGVG